LICGFCKCVKCEGDKIYLKKGSLQPRNNIFVERLWRSVKYENIFPRNYRTMQEAREGLSRYFTFYNEERPHQSLGYRTPKVVHFGKEEKAEPKKLLKRELSLTENSFLLC